MRYGTVEHRHCESMLVSITSFQKAVDVASNEGCKFDVGGTRIKRLTYSQKPKINRLHRETLSHVTPSSALVARLSSSQTVPPIITIANANSSTPYTQTYRVPTFSYNCIFQEEEEVGIRGVTIIEDLFKIVSIVIRSSVTTLDKRILPLQKTLGLDETAMEPSRMSLYRLATPRSLSTFT
ncbi:unnamed protein product [Lactuca saligna]|uniref:Uncharacterized protein n=1 Tax=Lactuca saligna TaxID=75948 RepID=A0AA35V2F7_LACSI|nr:unnamed protein product [Lactuca saligna]